MTRSLISMMMIVAALMIAALPLAAGEGMWQINRLDRAPVDAWHGAGLQLSPSDLYNPDAPALADAIVQVGGGTGSFVSAEGLIVTNHHVAFGALQRQSSVEQNVMTEGFLARSRDAEIPAPGYKAYVLKNVEEVTNIVLAKTGAEMSDIERYNAIDRVGKELVEKAEAAGDVHASFKEFFAGREYYLFTYFEIKDVRIVYAPPGAIGVYGGEVDNWMWPRHTGDFSFLRAYVAPDGKSATYSEDNVPYRPEHFLPVSIAPLAPGDFTMVLGYPGRTMRYRSSYAIDYVVNSYYPDRIQQYGDVIELLETIATEDPDAAIKTAGTLRSLGNSHKNNRGMLEGLVKDELLARKQTEEQQLRDYLNSHPEADEMYGSVLDEVAERYEAYNTFARQTGVLKRLIYWPTGMRAAYTIAKWAHEQEKDDIDRDNGYQDRDEERRRESIELADRSYAVAADKAIAAYFLTTLREMSANGDLPPVDEVLAGVGETPSEIDAFVAGLYKDTRIGDKDARMGLFGKTTQELAAIEDPLVDFAMRIVAAEETLDDRSDAFDGAMKKLRPRLLALREMVSPQSLYPDANFTMRVSVGKIKGYSPADAVNYEPFTTLDGVVAKHTGEEPFDAPKRLLELAKNEDYGDYEDPELGDVPVCFLSTDDVTGGNSGSPILNGRGEVIGLVFDGNYEAISADYQFKPDMTRTINVDSRYILFVAEKFSGATELLRELNVTGATEGAMR